VLLSGKGVALVTGASGLLGTKLVPQLVRRGWRVVAIYNTHRPNYGLTQANVKLVKLDIRNRVKLEDLILKTMPEVVIHAAALTNVDLCEKDKTLAWEVNVEATKSVVRASRVVKAHLIYVSTDYVFDGERGLYKESDIPSPINYYGMTKLIAEELVRSADILYTIVRTSAIYGVGGSKKSFAEYVAERVTRGEKVKALTDQYLSPIYNADLAEAIAEASTLKPMGTYHVAGERVSRFEFAVKIAEALDARKDLIMPAKMDDMKSWVARRPRDSSLDVSKAREIIGAGIKPLDDAVRRFASEWLGR